MNESELLAVVVEFSVGLGGFSAIAAAFIHQNQSMKAVDIYRILNLLMMALGPAFIALIGLGLMNVSASIQYANGLLLIYLGVGLLQSELGKRRLAEDQQKVLIPVVIVIMQSAFVLNALFQFLACTGVLQQAFIILYFGLTLVLAQALVQFVRLIIARPGK